MKKHHLLILLSILISSLSAQKLVVRDIQTKANIPNVYVFSQCQSALTNLEGQIALKGFCVDSTITLQHASYITQSIHLSAFQSDSLIEVLLIPDIFNLKEVVVAASKWNEEHREVPLTVKKITAKEAYIYSPQTSADLLSVNSKVFVQKSQLGGGSPMIRGFSANRVLLVVDGVRLNNAIFRGGNLQNVLNIDVNAVENVEVIFGPGSVIYGSDALGGVMSYSTLQTEFSKDKFEAKGNGLMRFSSANSEKTISASIKLKSKKWASVTSFSNSNFDDLRMGSQGHDSYSRDFYVLNDGKKDTVLENSDKNIQIGSGFSQINLLQKISFKPNKKWQYDYNFYFSKLSDVPRYDRLIQEKDGLPKYAEWYYGPQQWMMQSLNVAHHSSNALYDEAKATIAYQNYKESRHSRKLDSTFLKNQFEEVNILSTNLDFFKKLNSSNTIYYGMEGLFNLVNSKADTVNIYTQEREGAETRYPDNSKYFSTAFYITDKQYLSEKLIANGGLRLNFSSVQSTFSHEFFSFPYDNANSDNLALSGNLGLVYLPSMTSKFSLNFASGFRAPNVDDLAKVFDTGDNLVVPNPQLKPEHVYNVDLTFERQLWKRLNILVNGFYSYLDQAMIQTDFTFEGQDSIDYAGGMKKVKAITNKDNAQIYGVQASVEWKFYSNFFLKSSANYTKGYDSEGFGIRHVSPFFGATHLIYNNSKLMVDAYTIYNGNISYRNLAQSERDKPYMYDSNTESLPYASAWQTINLKLSYKINGIFSVVAGIENILDTRYRPYSSGIAASGRNFMLSLRISSF